MAYKPMKGCKREELDFLEFPLGLSFKIDGIRGMVYDNTIHSTSGTPLRNKQIQEYIKSIPAHLTDKLDFEVIAGEPNDKNVMQAATTAAMSTDAITDFRFYVFDDFSNTNERFEERYYSYLQRIDDIEDWCEDNGVINRFVGVEYVDIHDMESYEGMKRLAAELGYEGLYGKSWDGLYKHGRATPKQKWVWKDKPWTDEEGLVVDVIEMMENTNEAEQDAFGRVKRSTAAEGLVGKGYAGALVVTNDKYKDENGEPIPFRVSLGSLTMDQRKDIFEHPEEAIGYYVTYKFFDFGVVDVPRSPLFKSWRDISDIDTE